MKEHCLEVKEMVEEYVILVDQNDNAIGSEEKVKCHLPNGKLHRAFTALLFDKKGRLVLTRRSKEKMLWPNDWDGTVASHPREGETYTSSAERRMPEEVGVSCKMDYLMKFEYHVPYKDVGSENEICGTLIGIVDESTKFKMVEGEIDEIKWISPTELIREIDNAPETYCPWMLIALALLPESEKSMLTKYSSILSNWLEPSVIQKMTNATEKHLPKEKWGLVK
jgi:isopentenyl-diphosphate delta-isomerase